MSTTTRPLIDTTFQFVSNNSEKLLPALGLIFAEPIMSLCWVVTDGGFHLAPDRDHGRALLPNASWFRMHQVQKHLQLIVADIQRWLENMSPDEARSICGWMSTEAAYIADPGISLTGYSVWLQRARDGLHYMVTVTPAWV